MTPWIFWTAVSFCLYQAFKFGRGPVTEMYRRKVEDYDAKIKKNDRFPGANPRIVLAVLIVFAPIILLAFLGVCLATLALFQEFLTVL